MHIVFVIANNPSVPYFKLFMAEAALRKEDRFSFVAMSSSFPEMIAEAESFGFKGYWIPFEFAKHKSHMLRAFPRLYKLFRALKPDVVHTHLFFDSLPALLAARLAGVPVRVIAKQDVGFHHFYAKRWELADRFNNRNATHVLAVSEESKEFIRDVEKCPPGKLHVVHNGIATGQYSSPDAAQIKAFREQHHLEQRFVIGSVARFIEWKGYLEIVQAAEIVVKEIPEALFLWAGKGDQLPAIQKVIAEKGLAKNILILGYVDKALMPSCYGAMDVFLHAAFFEPFGFVIAEAMAAGLPVVATPTGAARDAIKHKVNGWLGEYRNPRSLAEGILFYYRNRPQKPFTPAQETAINMYDFKRTYMNTIKLYSTPPGD